MKCIMGCGHSRPGSADFISGKKSAHSKRKPSGEFKFIEDRTETREKLLHKDIDKRPTETDESDAPSTSENVTAVREIGRKEAFMELKSPRLHAKISEQTSSISSVPGQNVESESSTPTENGNKPKKSVYTRSTKFKPKSSYFEIAGKKRATRIRLSPEIFHFAEPVISIARRSSSLTDIRDNIDWNRIELCPEKKKNSLKSKGSRKAASSNPKISFSRSQSMDAIDSESMNASERSFVVIQQQLKAIVEQPGVIMDPLTEKIFVHRTPTDPSSVDNQSPKAPQKITQSHIREISRGTRKSKAVTRDTSHGSRSMSSTDLFGGFSPPSLDDLDIDFSNDLSKFSEQSSPYSTPTTTNTLNIFL